MSHRDLVLNRRWITTGLRWMLILVLSGGATNLMHTAAVRTVSAVRLDLDCPSGTQQRSARGAVVPRPKPASRTSRSVAPRIQRR